MRTYSISEFKAHALALIGAVAETGEAILVTKRGKTLVRIEPCREPERLPQPGRLAGTITYEADIVAPLGEGLWEAAREGERR